MPTVPVGNKQLGELSSVAVVASKTDTGVLRALEVATYAVALSNTPAQPVGVKNKFIGELSSIITTKMKNSGTSINAVTLSMYAVVKLAPPTALVATEIASYALIKSDIVTPAVLPQSKFINEFTTVAAVTVKDPTIVNLQAINLAMYAVVKYIKPRKELITLNIEYTADAHLNVELNQ